MCGRLPKDVHILISRTWGYANFPGEGDFANVINVKDIEMGRLSCIIQVPPPSHMSPAQQKRKTEEWVREMWNMQELTHHCWL